jgi:putative protease
MKKINLELLAPAGSLIKMKYALEYGADAVYAGVPDFSLRARINEFDLKSLEEGVKYAHKLNKKFYVTLNIYAHNVHLKKIESHLKKISKIDIDGVILSDPGILLLVKKHLPQVEIHLSTQANATNWQAVKFWVSQGIKRVILAREVTLNEIKEIKKNVPEVELEYFVHGAMCMSYSGRCMLSKWMRNKSANLGDCSQPCRWKYQNKKNNIKEMTVVDNQGEFEIDLEEDNQGTYFFNSQDLNLLNYLKDLSDAGVDSFKIEGRNKSVYYLVTVIRAYRNVIDAVSKKDNDLQGIIEREQNNLNDLVHRGYTTGFLLETEPEHNFANSHKRSNFEFVGEIFGKIFNKKNKLNLFEVKVHNAIYTQDVVEIVSRDGNFGVKILRMFDDKMEEVRSAHGGHGKNYYFSFDKNNISEMDLLRKKLK